MIFLFPDLETLRIALTSGQIPPDVSREPVEVAFNGDGRPSVKPHAIPPKAMQNALKRLGIKTGQAHHGEPMTLAMWPQILPVVRASGPPEFTPATPVLFELPVERFSSLVTEILRLGNDRQSFRLLSGEKEADQRVLLRVIGPPYYTLLRALDRLNADVVAYTEQAPAVWIEIGCTHPLATLSKVPDGQVLLLRAPREWKTITDGRFQDVYEVLDFQLPKSPVAFAEGKLKGKLAVPLRLAAGNAAEVPEMWVLKSDAFRVFDAFVRDADDRLMNRLMFAVALAENGERAPLIVLRTRTSKLTPPALELDGALGYVPFRRLNNLFLPVGTRLQPTLRRDAVRKMLAEDDAQIVWLTPMGEGRFVPESLPDAAFRPLADWVDYVIDHQRQTLQNWMQATRFDFDDFICKDETAIDRPKPPGKPKTRKPGERPDKIDGETAEATEGKGKNTSKAKDQNAYLAPQLPAKPDELKIKRTALEHAFLSIEGSLDAPDRLALWPQLARVNAALGDHAEAAICWLNGFWEMDEVPADGARTWMGQEKPTTQSGSAANVLKNLLSIPAPSHADLRKFTATFFAAGSDPGGVAILRSHQPAIVSYLDKHEISLPIRANWLMRRCMATLCGDVLGLARVRDRLLERLFTEGLRMQFDVPTFIRFAGRKESDRMRRILEVLHGFRIGVRQWLLEQDEAQVAGSAKTEKKQSKESGENLLHKSLSPTTWYAELIFAYGFARIGEDAVRKDLMATALTKLRALKGPEKTAQIPLILADAFEFRIEQVVRGEHAGPLPSAILGQLDSMNAELMYGVNKLRKHLHILEPHEKGDPYIVYKTMPDALNQQLAALPLIADAKKLTLEIRRIIYETLKKAPRETRMVALSEIVPLTIRIGEAFAKELFDQVLPLVEPDKAATSALIGAEWLGRLIDAVIPVAANYGWTELVRQLLDRFIQTLATLDEPNLMVAINFAVGRWRRALAKCGLSEQVRKVLMNLSAMLDNGRSIEKIRDEYAGNAKRKTWIDMLRAQLLLAECWLSLGEQSKAQPVIDEARSFLFDNIGKSAKERPVATHYVLLACTYIRTVGQNSDLDFVVARLNELLSKMDVIPNATTTKAYYSPLHLTVVESIVLTIISEDLILGDETRRYLDDDEYLVRRRIHGEMRKLLAQSGL
jgi:hypothetical protein